MSSVKFPVSGSISSLYFFAFTIGEDNKLPAAKTTAASTITPMPSFNILFDLNSSAVLIDVYKRQILNC